MWECALLWHCWCPKQPLQFIPQLLGHAAPCPSVAQPGRAGRRWVRTGSVVLEVLLGQDTSTFPVSFPSARLQLHSHPLLCCLPPLFGHTFGISDGFAPSEGDPCPVTARLQIPCVFLSWGSAQLWLLPVPLPYTLTATPLLLFCTHSV